MADDPQGNSGFLTELDVRVWLRDNNPAANLLLDDYEFTPEEIRTAWTLVVDHWNDQPPYIGNYSVDKFPYRGKLLQATTANLLFMAAHRFRRNALQYTSGGLSVADQEKFQQYDGAGQALWNEFKEWVVVQKRALNAQRGWAILS